MWPSLIKMNKYPPELVLIREEELDLMSPLIHHPLVLGWRTQLSFNVGLSQAWFDPKRTS